MQKFFIPSFSLATLVHSMKPVRQNWHSIIMGNKYIYILLVIGLMPLGAVRAQIVEPEIKTMMAQATTEMNAGHFNDANITFRKMLATKKVLPTNMSYLFAETLFMINQYHNSESFLIKYMDLAGKGGDYYQQAVELQRAIQEKMMDIQECSQCNVFGYRLKMCNLCGGEGTITSTCYYCKGLGKTNCLTCQGNGVIISKNIFDVDEYKSCHVCDTKGYIVCKVCKGNNVIKNQCPDCLGSKNTPTEEICEHQSAVGPEEINVEN